MKKLVLILAILALLPVAAQAAPIVGQTISFNWVDPHGTSGGGPFLVTGPTDDPYSFQTFCVSLGVYITPGNPYYIAGITNYNSDGKVLTDGVANLYLSFLSNLANGTVLNAFQATQFQNAIWAGMGYTGVSIVDNPYYNYAATWGFSTYTGGRVAILNLTNGANGAPVQNQLVAVPEPGSMMLFGSGLVGLAAAIRRRNKK